MGRFSTLYTFFRFKSSKYSNTTVCMLTTLVKKVITVISHTVEGHSDSIIEEWKNEKRLCGYQSLGRKQTKQATKCKIMDDF